MVTFFSGSLALGLLAWGAAIVISNRSLSLYALAAAVFLGWVYFSAGYFKPFISFDSRRQRLLDKLWRYFSIGTFGFVFFGTLLPLVRKVIAGF